MEISSPRSLYDFMELEYIMYVSTYTSSVRVFVRACVCVCVCVLHMDMCRPVLSVSMVLLPASRVACYWLLCDLSLTDLCLEKRVFYRMISGFHTSINVDVTANWLIPGERWPREHVPSRTSLQQSLSCLFRSLSGVAYVLSPALGTTVNYWGSGSRRPPAAR